jgi:hypothetical protein
MMEIGEPPQEIEMMLAPGDDVVEIITGGDGRAGLASGQDRGGFTRAV